MMRLKNIALLILCYLYALLRGRATTLPGQIKTIIVFQGSKMGDMVCTTPMFRAIKKHYPQARLVVIGDRVNEGLLAHHPRVDEYVNFQDIPFFRLVRQFRARRADIAICTEQSVEELAALFLSGVPFIVATSIGTPEFAWLETRPYRLLRRLVIVKPYFIGKYFPRQYLTLLEPLGIEESDTTKELSFSETSRERVRSYLKERGITPKHLVVGISPSAGNKIKNWPAERFAEAAEDLYKKYQAKIVIIGGPKDRNEVSEMKRHLAETPYHDTCGLFSVDELKALIAAFDLLIAVDTGPIYIAEALGVATVDIVGPVDEREQPPVGERHKVVFASGRAPAIHLFLARRYDREQVRRQVEAVTVPMVIDAADAILSSLPKRHVD